MPTLSATVLAAVSAILALIANYLKSDKLPDRTNLLIGIVATLAIGAVTAWETGFTGDILQNVLMVLTCWVLFLHQLLSLLQTAQGASSPLAVATQQIPTQPSLASVVAAPVSTLANALIHIASVSTLHVNAPISTSTSESTPDPVATVQESVNASSPIAGAIVSDVMPVAITGVTTQEEANQKTQKIAVVKPTTPLV